VTPLIHPDRVEAIKSQAKELPDSRLYAMRLLLEKAKDDEAEDGRVRSHQNCTAMSWFLSLRRAEKE
jgi:hypothetical protein